MYLVVVAPSDSMPSEVAGLLKLAYQPVRGTFGQVDARCDVAEAGAWLLRDADQDSSVLGEERGHDRTVCPVGSKFK